MTAISKQALFSTFYTQQRKDDVIVTSHCRFDPDFLYRKIFILSQSNSVQNLSSLTLKTKELLRGGGKHLPPVLHQPKKSGANRVNGHLVSWSVLWERHFKGMAYD